MVDPDELAAAAYLPIGARFEPPPDVAPGVQAFVRHVGPMTIIPFVWATRPGNGDVGRWLDSLPTDATIIFVEVGSPRLAGMLERRGFWPGRMRFGDESADVMLRRVRAGRSGQVPGGDRREQGLHP